jgi:uncharacterized protein (DUF58 family)
MGYSSQETWGDAPAITKFRYASWVAAALSHLSLRQRDAVSLVVFDEKVRMAVPPSTGVNHYDEVIRQIEKTEPAASVTPEKALVASANAIHRRGLVVLVSDLLCAADETMKAIRLLRARGNDVIVLRVLDPAEVHFEFEKMTRFDDLEGPTQLLIDPRAIRRAYIEEFQAHDERLRHGCQSQNIDLVRLTTDTSLDVGLVAYLGARASRARARA